MDPIREKILEEYKKASLKRREELAKRYGFNTPEELLTNLVQGVYGAAGEPKGREKLLEEEMEKKAEKEIEEKKEDTIMDLVLAFDVTGSMAAYRNAVRKHARDMVEDMFKSTPNLKMKIVVFGDYCDMESATKFGKAYQESDFTNDQNHLIDFINSSRDTGGGDSDEFYELVIKKVVEETPWRDGKKLFILIGDYTPHPIGYTLKPYIEHNKIDWRQEAVKAKVKRIQIDTFKIIVQHTWYDELSKITDGVCLPFQTAEKTGETVSAAYFARTDDVKFRTMSFMAEKRGDTEMIGVYKSLAKKMDETKKGE